MKKIALLIVFSCLIISCTTSEYELARVESPDGKGIAVLVTKKKTGVPLPGPEPPSTKARWVKLTVSIDGKKIHDTGFEEVGIYQRGSFAFDVSWAPESSIVAYRMLNTLRIMGKNGKASSFNIVKDNALVSSFKWISQKKLLIVSKGVNKPLGSPIHYHGYLAESTYIKISELNLDTGIVEHFRQEVSEPTFLFQSIGFVNNEISPYSSRVAFSDGANINVFDVNSKKIIATTHIKGSIEGIWWATDNTVIIGSGLLSSSTIQFFSFNVVNGKVTDKTNALLPLWDSFYRNGDWFKNGL